jgi:antitoxin component YwqK of YwqJK toxin-antitoxin module
MKVTFPILFLVLLAALALGLPAQDTIRLNGRVIRVGELEWEMYKGWTGKDFVIAENKELYGNDVVIYLGFHRSRTVREIVFGHFTSDTAQGVTDFVAEGPARYYDESGRMIGKRSFANGDLHGVFEDYHPTGRVSATGRYVDGKLQGDYRSFYESGELQCVTPFVDDQEQGTEKCYHRNGRLRSKLFYEAGKPEGPDSSWYDNGALEAAYLFRNGMEQDTGHHWHSNGAPFTDRIFLQGKLVEVLFVKDKSGNDLPPGDFANGRGNVNVYNDEGKLKEIVNYRDGFVRKVRYIE